MGFVLALHLFAAGPALAPEAPKERPVEPSSPAEPPGAPRLRARFAAFGGLLLGDLVGVGAVVAVDGLGQTFGWGAWTGLLDWALIAALGPLGAGLATSAAVPEGGFWGPLGGAFAGQLLALACLAFALTLGVEWGGDYFGVNAFGLLAGAGMLFFHFVGVPVGAELGVARAGNTAVPAVAFAF